MRKLKKFAIFVVCTISVCACAVLGINFHVKNSAKEYILAPDSVGTDYDCILVLGCGVHGETPSHMLEDRLLQGTELCLNGASKKILMSGDHGRKGYDEVNVMKNFAIECGIASEDVFMDHAGFSTYESMYRARDIFKAQKILIVTQEYHLYRAIYVARALGLDAYGATSDLRTYSGQFYRNIREILARNKDFVYALVQPEPTYLGEAVPVWGNGDLSNG